LQVLDGQLPADAINSPATHQRQRREITEPTR